MTTRSVSLTLLRERPGGREVFWAERQKRREFLGGFHAFFAGHLEKEDPDEGFGALRETFEECGLFLGEAKKLSLFEPQGRSTVPFRVADAWRARLHCFGWWSTPKWLEPPFLTQFFGLFLTQEEGSSLDELSSYLDQEEFSRGEWITPEEALSRWSRGEVFLSAPIIDILRSLLDGEDSGDGEDAGNRPFGVSSEDPYSDGKIECIEHFVVYPLPTETLPPATHTNALLIGNKHFLIVDPGPLPGPDLDPLIELVEWRIEKGDKPLGIFISHHHRDHIGGAQELTKRFSVPLCGTEETLQQMGLEPSQEIQILKDGERINVDGTGPLEVIRIEGHARGHAGLYLPERKLFFCADLVASKGTIVIIPPDGHMGTYLESLKRIELLAPKAMLPSHGGLIVEPLIHLRSYFEHRMEREAKVLKALRSLQRADVSALLPLVYPEVPPTLWPLAAKSLEAHLIHLEELGMARKVVSCAAEIYEATSMPATSG